MTPSSSPSSTSCLRKYSPLDEPGLDEVLVEIEILPEDIAEMQYHLNECPMANMAIDNAVSYALYRVVKPGLRISISIQQGAAVASIGDRKFPLEDELSFWLAKALMGYSPEPITSTLCLPEILVRSKIAARRKKLQLLQFYRERVDSTAVNREATAGA